MARPRRYQTLSDPILGDITEDQLADRLKGEPMAREKQTPGDFYEDMMRPEAPDEMAFQIDRPAMDDDPLTTFSMEAVNEIAEQFRMFLMARIVARSDSQPIMPKHLRAYVKLDWNVDDPHPSDDPRVGPYFVIDADKGLEPLDGSKRYQWKHG